MGSELADLGAAAVGSVASSLSGSARDVLQARDIAGGVHFHGAPPGARVPVPRQLPPDVPGFVGRAVQLEQLTVLAQNMPEAGVRLVVVAGTAGVGKTSLAVRFAHRVRSRFPDGQLFVNLHGYDPGPPLAPAAALERFLRAMGTPPGAISGDLEERAEMYRSLLAERRILVVLDNAATVGQVRPLLPAEPGCLVLVTSRSRLSGLSARDGAQRITLGLLSEPEAVQLITAVTARHRAADTAAQVTQLARLCAHLPLALRIAAERAAARPLMPLGELIADLRGESSLWDALSLDEGADAVRAVFAWSYRALPPLAARMFRRLGLHPGAQISIGAGAAVADEPIERARRLLDLLESAHLLEQSAAGHYRFHDLLRAYAADQAHREETPAQQAAAVRRMVQWYLHTAHAAVRAAQSLFTPPPLDLVADGVPPQAFPEPAGALDWFAAERTNLLAVARAAATSRMDRLAWQLAATVFPLHVAYGALDDLLEVVELGLQAAQRLGDPASLATMWQASGITHRAAGNLPRAEQDHRTALDLFTDLDDRDGIVQASTCLGLVHADWRDLPSATVCFKQALAHAEQGGPSAWITTLLMNLSDTQLKAGHLREAADLADEALERARNEGIEIRLQLEPVLVLTRTERESGNLQSARARLSQALAALHDGMVYRSMEHAVLLEHAALTLAQGEGEQALVIAWRCALLAHSLHDRHCEALSLDAIGQALAHLGRTEEAADFHRAAATTARDHANPFETAEILAHLAETLDVLGEHDQAEYTRTDALNLITPYADPRAIALHRELTEALHVEGA